MRLLERKPDGELVLTNHPDREPPAYAILSHTWAVDDTEEVTFHDLEAGSGNTKVGWQKIDFCAKQAAADGLRYFWIDTCCIDKKNAVEISTAINSMFRWYQKAARCYVFLSDVSKPDDKGNDHNNWESAFRKSMVHPWLDPSRAYCTDVGRLLQLSG
jgi:hypothetical protein